MTRDGRRLLGVFAHPDDEVFCAGGTLAKAVAEGSEAMVVSATRGEAGQIRAADAATRQTLGRVREQELRRACACLGVQHVRLLDHRDGTLGDVDAVALADEVAAVVEEFAPHVVVTFGDDGAYGHPDHVAISRATTAAVRGRAAAGTRLYHSHFPRSRLLLRERLARWLVGLDRRFRGSADFPAALSLFAQESTTMRFASDEVAVRYFPPGFGIVEQGEQSSALYLLLIGEVDVMHEDAQGVRQPLARLGAGEFFGELGAIGQQARTAHVVAATSVACLELAPDPLLHAGRGRDARLIAGDEEPAAADEERATAVIDVRAHVDAKMRAIAAHRSQYPIEPDMFPADVLADMFGREHYVRILPVTPPEDDLFGP